MVGRAIKAIPKNFEEAMESPEAENWKEAMREEMQFMKNHQV